MVEAALRLSGVAMTPSFGWVGRKGAFLARAQQLTTLPVGSERPRSIVTYVARRLRAVVEHAALAVAVLPRLRKQDGKAP